MTHNPFKDNLDNLRKDADIMDVGTDHRPRPQQSARHIGCPLPWFKRVLPIVRGKNELAVALYIYRLRSVRRRQTVTVSNSPLLAELGVDRYAKYRALRRLADAGIITLRQRGTGRAPEVVFHDRKAATNK